MSESSTNPPADRSPFDAEQFARQTVRAIEWGGHDADVLRQQVFRIEECIAARWPRRWLLWARLRREIRASVSTFEDDHIPRGNFLGRRSEWSFQQSVQISEMEGRGRAALHADDDPPGCICDIASADICPVHRSEPEDDYPEPFCSACGATVGIFLGHGKDWRHFRGVATADTPVELFDADHEAVIAWREAQQPGGGFLA